MKFFTTWIEVFLFMRIGENTYRFMLLANRIKNSIKINNYLII